MLINSFMFRMDSSLTLAFIFPKMLQRRIIMSLLSESVFLNQLSHLHQSLPMWNIKRGISLMLRSRQKVRWEKEVRELAGRSCMIFVLEVLYYRTSG